MTARVKKEIWRDSDGRQSALLGYPDFKFQVLYDQAQHGQLAFSKEDIGISPAGF